MNNNKKSNRFQRWLLPGFLFRSLINGGWITLVFYIVAFGTFIETGTGMIHAISERIDFVFLVIFFVPLLTIGLWRISKARAQ